MIFTTPCFVRVEDAEKRDELIGWCAGIGYDTNDWRLSPTVCYVFAENEFAGRSGILALDSLSDDAIDCGDNIELFKALAAKNDVNDYMQYLIDNVGNMGICTQQSPYRVVQMAGISFNIDNYRKATAQEIIEHFNRKQI